MVEEKNRFFKDEPLFAGLVCRYVFYSLCSWYIIRIVPHVINSLDGFVV